MRRIHSALTPNINLCEPLIDRMDIVIKPMYQMRSDTSKYPMHLQNKNIKKMLNQLPLIPWFYFMVLTHMLYAPIFKVHQINKQ